jgi:hypothetical protein
MLGVNLTDAHAVVRRSMQRCCEAWLAETLDVLGGGLDRGNQKLTSERSRYGSGSIYSGGRRIRFRDTLIRAGLVDSMNSVSASTKRSGASQCG